MTKSKDSDVPYFFSSFRHNLGKRHFMLEKFRQDYEVLYKRLEGNFSFMYLVNVRAHLRSAVDTREILMKCDCSAAVLFSTLMRGSLRRRTGRNQKNSSR